jgi:hypothetical protein
MPPSANLAAALPRVPAALPPVLAEQARRLAQRALTAGLAITHADGSTTPIPIGFVPLTIDDLERGQRRRVASLLTRATQRVARWRMAPAQRGATLQALGPAERRLLLATWHHCDELAVARVDFLGEPTLQALEVNATIPAMQGYSDIAAEAWLATMGADPQHVASLIAANGSNTQALLDVLVELHVRRRGAAPGTIGLLCRRHDAQLSELGYLQRRFEAAGFDSRIVHPDQLQWDAATAFLRHGGEPLHLLYRHLFLRRLDEAPSPAIEAALLHRGPRGSLILNPPAPHLELKSTHALLSQAADDDTLAAAIGLDDDERAAARAHVPWTRWLHDPRLSERDHATLLARIVDEPAEMVLKRSASYGGRDVFVGAALQRGEGWDSVAAAYPGTTSWPALVQRVVADHGGGGFVAQRRVRSETAPQWLCTPEAAIPVNAITDYSAYASLGAAARWNGVARAATSDIVNLVRGGAVVPVIARAVYQRSQRTPAS